VRFFPFQSNVGVHGRNNANEKYVNIFIIFRNFETQSNKSKFYLGKFLTFLIFCNFTDKDFQALKITDRDYCVFVRINEIYGET
jgi:hypothetical protein